MHATDPAPEYGRIPDACRRYGLSRSRLYLLAGEGLVRFIKVGNATLVDLSSVRRYLAACPTVRPSRTDAAAVAAAYEARPPPGARDRLRRARGEVDVPT
jgi:hypothetical protein